MNTSSSLFIFVSLVFGQPLAADTTSPRSTQPRQDPRQRLEERLNPNPNLRRDQGRIDRQRERDIEERRRLTNEIIKREREQVLTLFNNDYNKAVAGLRFDPPTRSADGGGEYRNSMFIQGIVSVPPTDLLDDEVKDLNEMREVFSGRIRGASALSNYGKKFNEANQRWEKDKTLTDDSVRVPVKADNGTDIKKIASDEPTFLEGTQFVAEKYLGKPAGRVLRTAIANSELIVEPPPKPNAPPNENHPGIDQPGPTNNPASKVHPTLPEMSKFLRDSSKEAKRFIEEEGTKLLDKWLGKLNDQVAKAKQDEAKDIKKINEDADDIKDALANAYQPQNMGGQPGGGSKPGGGGGGGGDGSSSSLGTPPLANIPTSNPSSSVIPAGAFDQSYQPTSSNSTDIPQSRGPRNFAGPIVPNPNLPPANDPLSNLRGGAGGPFIQGEGQVPGNVQDPNAPATQNQQGAAKADSGFGNVNQAQKAANAGGDDGSLLTTTPEFPERPGKLKLIQQQLDNSSSAQADEAQAGPATKDEPQPAYSFERNIAPPLRASGSANYPNEQVANMEQKSVYMYRGYTQRLLKTDWGQKMLGIFKGYMEQLKKRRTLAAESRIKPTIEAAIQ